MNTELTFEQNRMVQYDGKVRMVALENLKAMCKRISGMSHHFQISKVSRSRVHVEYSNPSEYGAPNPMTAVFPTIPNQFQHQEENPYVLLDSMCFLRVINDTWHGEGWQAFTVLLDYPQLWRSPMTGEWQTREEIEAARAEQATQ